MARYALLKNVCVGQFFYANGSTLADSIGNALPGDLLVSGLTTNPQPNLLAALDSAGATALGTPVRTFAQLCNPGFAGITQGFSATGSGN